MATKLGHARLKRDPRPGGGLLEYHAQNPVLEGLEYLPGAMHGLEFHGA
jgi:hypothetical protein